MTRDAEGRGTIARAGTLLALGAACTAAGCDLGERVSDVRIANERFGRISVAVAPAINQSGSADFDRNRFADLMVSELTFASEVSAIPVSRVLAVLASQGKDGVESPEHAMAVLEHVDADAILVFSVTEYDPYDPPSIGITGQLYGAVPGESNGASDPIALSRRAALAGSRPSETRRGLLAQTQDVFDASHDDTVRGIKAFAAERRGGPSPYRWRKFVVSQQNFIRFCCYSTISQLLSWPEDSEFADGDPRSERTP